MKTASTFFPGKIRDIAARNIAALPAAKAERDRLVAEAAPWLALSEEALWSRVFGPSLPRSWMVWSDGHCPLCKKSVVMYEWVVDPLNLPWKLNCPHCAQSFPKNDFGAYYRSGLDASGEFDASRADRSLLFNAEHPDPADPLHRFGVDDGTGFVMDGKKWRFIAAYLVWGEWKKGIVAGIRSLAAAFVVTGDAAYSRRALVMLDRVADFYPRFDFFSQGEVYETPGHNGYVSVWHDTNMEQSDLLIAYDQVFDGLPHDAQLHSFLADKARGFSMPLPKNSAADIQRNIEERLFRDALKHREKIHTNFPGMHTVVVTTRAILDWPACKDEIYDYWADLLQRTTATDGVTGEKGLPSYTRITLRWMANAASLFMLSDPQYIATMIRRVPNFARTFRFHIDTWCGDQQYYPNIGDGTYFGASYPTYVGLAMVTNNPNAQGLTKDPGAKPSMDRMIYEIAEATGDVDFYRLLVKENRGQTAGCVFDLTLDNIDAAEAKVQQIVREHGPAFRLGCVDLRQWHLAILRSGAAGKERALWLDYDSGGYHCHQDAMNIGLFAHGMDLMPDAGYPPVQFGGWGTPKAKWYAQTAAHNSVVVDGKSQRDSFGKPIGGETRFWTQAPSVKLVQVAAPTVYGIEHYDRTLLLVDLDENDFYVVDHFRVVGGNDHAKFMHSNFATMTTHGLSLSPSEDYGHDTLLRHFQRDTHPPQGWSADWKIEDRFGVLPQPKDLHLRYTDFTIGAEASPHEGWYLQGSIINSVNEQWVPRVMVRRRRQPGEGALKSNFIGVIEPYVGTRKIASMRRLAPLPDDQNAAENHAFALEVNLTDGTRDVVVMEAGWGLAQHQIRVEGYGAVIRYDAMGRVIRLITLRAYAARVGNIELRVEAYTQSLELAFDYTGPTPRVTVHTKDASERYGIELLKVDGVSLLDQIG